MAPGVPLGGIRQAVGCDSTRVADEDGGPA